MNTEGAAVQTRPRHTKQIRRSSTAGGDTTEPKNADRVFLTPRVIDARAYDEMSSDLRNLIERAGEITSQLIDAVKNAQTASSQLKKASRLHEERLNLGMRLFETIQKRANEIEEMTKHVATQINHLEQLHEIADEESQNFQTRLRQETASNILNIKQVGHETREEIEQHCNGFSQQINRWDCTAENLNARLDGLEDEIHRSSQPTITHLTELIDEAKRITGENASRSSTDHPSLLSTLNQLNEAQEQIAFSIRQAKEITLQCDSVRNLMGEETILAAQTADLLSSESEALQTTIDAAAEMAQSLTEYLTNQKREISDVGHEQLEKIDAQTQEEIKLLRSMKSEMVGIAIDLDQRKESVRDLLNEQIKAAESVENDPEHVREPGDTASRADSPTPVMPQQLEPSLERIRRLTAQRVARNSPPSPAPMIYSQDFKE